VDYAQTLDQMIEGGTYDWKSNNITAKLFPIVGEGEVDLKPYLIHFNCFIDSDDAEKELETMGKRPGKIEELLAFGKTYPEVQWKFPIVALGSVAEIDGDLRVAYLGRDGSKRELRLFWRSRGWRDLCRFLAFDK
jgi:hypothetical protein